MTTADLTDTQVKLTPEELSYTMMLIAQREMWLARLQCTAEARELSAANAAMNANEEKLSAKYGASRPMSVAGDGTILSATGI